jgi:hypothetical protein
LQSSPQFYYMYVKKIWPSHSWCGLWTIPPISYVCHPKC